MCIQIYRTVQPSLYDNRVYKICFGTRTHAYIRDCKVMQVGKIYSISEHIFCKVIQGKGNVRYVHDRFLLMKYLGTVLVYVNF